jgi:phage terminase large subunit-like protein
MPEDVAADPEKRRRDRVPYDLWVEQGFITATPGNVIDYAWIHRDLKTLSEDLSILQVGYDPWNATQFATQAGEELGLEMVPIRQGFPSLTAPTKELLKLAVSGRLRHGGNPVLNWQAANLTVRIDPAGNVKPDREKSRAKIDGVVALIMALDRALRNEGSPVSGSVYRERGLLVL